MTIDLSVFEILLSVLVTAVIVLLVLRRDGPKKADDTLTLQLQMHQNNRDYMERQERMFRELSTSHQQMITLAGRALEIVAPLTPIKSDDAAARYLDDIRTPGPPAEQPTPESSNDMALPTMDGNRVQPPDA